MTDSDGAVVTSSNAVSVTVNPVLAGPDISYAPMTLTQGQKCDSVCNGGIRDWPV